VEILDAPARLDEGWEEIVEVSFSPVTTQLCLASCMGEIYDLPDLQQLGVRRVRYSAARMDEARDAEANLVEREPGAEPLDRYLLQLWPAPPAPDRLIRRSSEIAAYWHGCTRAPAPDLAAHEASASTW